MKFKSKINDFYFHTHLYVVLLNTLSRSQRREIFLKHPSNQAKKQYVRCVCGCGPQQKGPYVLRLKPINHLVFSLFLPVSSFKKTCELAYTFRVYERSKSRYHSTYTIQYCRLLILGTLNIPIEIMSKSINYGLF